MLEIMFRSVYKTA